MTESSQFKKNMGEIIEKKWIPVVETFYKKTNQNLKNYSFPKQPEPPNKNLKKQVSIKLPEKTHNLKVLSSTNLQLVGRKENETRIDFREDNMNENLKFQYGYGEAWKKYLSHISKLLNEGKNVQTKILAESVGVNTRNTRKYSEVNIRRINLNKRRT